MLEGNSTQVVKKLFLREKILICLLATRVWKSTASKLQNQFVETTTTGLSNQIIGNLLQKRQFKAKKKHVEFYHQPVNIVRLEKSLLKII